jgi:hypothetical protein
MPKAYFMAISALAVMLTFGGRMPLRAADGGEKDVLKMNGLTAARTLWVLEAEVDFKNKLNDARRQLRQLEYAVMLQRGTLSAKDYQDTVKNVTNQINQMRAQVTAFNQQMNRMPRGRRGMLMNNYVQAEYNELLMYRNQLQMEINLESNWLNQLKAQQADPKSKDKIDAEVNDRRETYHQAMLDLRTLADSTTEKYAEVAKSEEVKKALVAAGKGVKDKPRLGPSHEFLNNVKLFEKLERAESGEEPKATKSKSGRRSRTGSKSRRAADDAS